MCFTLAPSRPWQELVLTSDAPDVVEKRFACARELAGEEEEGEEEERRRRRRRRRRRKGRTLPLTPINSKSKQYLNI